MLADSLGPLPERTTEVMSRSPWSAGHCVHRVFRLCNRPDPGRSAETQRFGVVGFAISADRTEALMNAVLRMPESTWNSMRIWEKLDPKGGGTPELREVHSEAGAVAEINFVSNAPWGYSKRDEIVRHVARRQA